MAEAPKWVQTKRCLPLKFEMSVVSANLTLAGPSSPSATGVGGWELTLIRNWSEHEVAISDDLARITTRDYEWWLERIHQLDWVFAVTYAEGAPHEYVMADRSLDFTPDDCVRAARVIRTFGEPAKFFNTTRTYLEDADGWKYWDMAGVVPHKVV